MESEGEGRPAWVGRVLRAALAGLATAALVALEGGRGLLWHYMEVGDDGPQAIVLQALAPTIAAVAAIVWLRKSPRTILLISAAMAGAVALFRMDNLLTLDGDKLTSFVVYGFTLSVPLLLLARRSAAFRTAVTDVAILLTGFLSASGLVLWLKPAQPVRLSLLDVHALVGSQALAIFVAFLYAHLQGRERRASVLERTLGFLAVVAAGALILSGLNRVASGIDRGFGSTVLHLGAAVATLVTVGVHAWRARESARPAGSAVRTAASAAPARVVAYALLAVAGVAWGSFHAWDPRVHPEDADGFVETAEALAAPRDAPVELLARRRLDPNERSPGCFNTGSCHSDRRGEWSDSAHRFSASPLYNSVVEVLVREQGVASTRLCATCHDPVPLFAGELTDGARYPKEGSPGVPCLACHLARPAEGGVDAAPSNGRYRLAKAPLFQRQLGAPAMQVFTVYENIDLHFATVSTAYLRDDAMCISCHQLQVNGVHLRETGSEFRAAGLKEPGGQKPLSCRSCHMPAMPYPTDERHPNDHRMLGANFGLGAADPALQAARLKFVQDSLDVAAERALSASGARVVGLTIRNSGGGHGFPTAPQDLVRWFVEARPASAPDTAFARVGPETLFGETLFDAEGRALLEHQVWRVHRAVHDGERIAPGETRRFELELPQALAAGTLVVRLATRRVPAPLVDRVAARGGMTATVEVWRGTVAESD